MQKNGYEFSGLPKYYPAEDYKETTERIIERYSKIKGLISIYNWGDPSVPGISDLDLVLVFSGNAGRPLPFSKRSFYFLDSKTKYLARHPFIFIDSESFKNARYVYSDTNFKLVYGKKIKIKKLSKKDDYFSKVALLNDIIIRHYPRDFLEQHVSKRINVRDTLLRLNSLKYTIKALGKTAKISSHGWNEKLDKIGSLRKGWFNSSDFELLAELNEAAVNITMEIIEGYSKFLAESGIVKIKSGSVVMYNGIKNRSLFTGGWSRPRALHEMSGLAGNNKKIYSVLPLELCAQLFEYSKHDGPISSYIRKRLSGNLDYKLSNNVIGKRIKILNRQAALASKLRHSDFAAFFDFGYRSKSGINNWLLGLLDFARH